MMNQTNSGFLNSIPPVTKNLIIINLLFWVASLALPKVGIDLVDLLGLHFPGATDFKAYQIVSYMFMHDTHSFAHVFFNMFAVYMFGRVLENVCPQTFLDFLLRDGYSAGLVQEVVWFFNLRDVIFASQDMINLNGARLSAKRVLELFRDHWRFGCRIRNLVGIRDDLPNVPLYLMFIPIPIKAKYFVIFYGLAELFMGVASFGGDTVAHFAHLGGYVIRLFPNSLLEKERCRQWTVFLLI